VEAAGLLWTHGDFGVLLQKKVAVGPKGGKAQAKKKANSKFVIDCTTAETDSILDCANFVRSPTLHSWAVSLCLAHVMHYHVFFRLSPFSLSILTCGIWIVGHVKGCAPATMCLSEL
jgi:hypothetical protein